MKTQDSMRTLLSSALQRAGIGQQVHAAMVVEVGDTVLQEVFGEGVQAYATCHAYVGGALKIACTHAALAQEIQLQQTHIIERLTEALPAADIERIYVLHRDAPQRGAAWHEQHP